MLKININNFFKKEYKLKGKKAVMTRVSRNIKSSRTSRLKISDLTDLI